jgi:flagellin-like protein
VGSRAWAHAFPLEASRTTRPRDEGVSDVVGSVLLVAITVVAAVAFGAILFAYDGPEPKQHARLAASIDAGASGWGTGDESLRIQHLGGHAMDAESTAVVYNLDGVATRLEGSALGSAFADGRLSIGETWSLALPLQFGDRVEVVVVGGRSGTPALLSSASLEAGVLGGPACTSDLAPPVGTSWTQEPADVTSTTAGDVTVTVRLVDACSGVDPDTVPRLLWCVDVSCSSYTDAGAMTSLGGHQWRGTVPHAGSWLADAAAGKTLHYHVAPVADLAGNSAATETRRDLVDLVGTRTYPASFAATTGTLAAFASLQSDTDAGAEAVLAEGLVAGPPATGGPTKFSGTTASTGSATSPNNALASDDVRATMGTTGGFLEVTGLDLPAGALTVTAVTIGFEGRKDATGGTDPTVRLDHRVGAGAYVTGTNLAVTANADTDHVRALAGPFTVADVEAMTVRLFHVTDTNRDVQVDHVFATVTYTTAGADQYQMSIQLDWAGVPAGAAHMLELRYRVTSPGDTFTLQVWNGATWRSCPGSLDATTPTVRACPLVLPAEYLAGSPRVRLVDATPSGAAQGTLYLDSVRVASA